jgi:hypothetical protein
MAIPAITLLIGKAINASKNRALIVVRFMIDHPVN